MFPNVLDELGQMNGCEFGTCLSQHDARGDFRKIIDARFFEHNPDDVVREVFLNHSMRGVVRGFHLQWPPAAHSKMIACVSGRFFDVLLDLRRSSPTYKRFAIQEMRPGQFAYVPKGIAHAFQALEDGSTMLYATTSAHAPAFDGGVNPMSCAIEWPIAEVIVSDRDRSLPPLDALDSPFD